MFSRAVVDIIFAFIEDGPFLAETGDIRDPAIQVTRHGIAHGTVHWIREQGYRTQVHRPA
jgi:hypothetical protein